jgi:hypothetical protein
MSIAEASATPQAGPRTGDKVRVRSREEILATLDKDGSIDALPFMPEMLEFADKEFTVSARADKTCDTLFWTGNRRMEKTVHLVGARCSGTAHGGCEAYCMLFFREEWLEWADRPGLPIAEPAQTGGDTTEEDLHTATRQSGEPDAPYRCQATEHFNASSPIPPHNYYQYVHDVRIKNVSAWVAFTGLSVFAFNKYQRLSKKFLSPRLQISAGAEYPFVKPTGTGERIAPVPLQPGDLVEVRSKEEIMATLGPDQRNNKMWFDAEMLPYIGQRARVVRKVTKILNENTGRMIKLADCYILENMICLGLYHRFCQRAITPYWRSSWLRKIDEPATATSGGGTTVSTADGS